MSFSGKGAGKFHVHQTEFGKGCNDLGRIRYFICSFQDFVNFMSAGRPVISTGLPQDCRVTAYCVDTDNHHVCLWIYHESFVRFPPKTYLLGDEPQKFKVRPGMKCILYPSEMHRCTTN